MELLDIIEKQITSYYGDYSTCKWEEYTYNKKELKEFYEVKFKNNGNFYYLNNEIYLKLDLNWSKLELKNFFNDTINQKNIIDAINDETLKLNLRLVQDKQSFMGEEIGEPHYNKYYSIRNSFKNIVEECLKNIGINVDRCDFDYILI